MAAIPKVYLLEEVAKKLRLGLDDVKRAVESGEIPAFKILGKWRVTKATLLRIMGENADQDGDLADVDRADRLRLLRRYAANKQRINRYAERLPDPILEIRIYRLLVLQELLKRQIEDVGGLPKAWRLDGLGAEHSKRFELSPEARRLFEEVEARRSEASEGSGS